MFGIPNQVYSTTNITCKEKEIIGTLVITNLIFLSEKSSSGYPGAFPMPA